MEDNLDNFEACLEYLKNEYDRAIEREKRLEYKLGILWGVIIFLVTNTKEIIFSKELSFAFFLNRSYFINLNLVLKILILVSIIFISYFSYNTLKLSEVFKATTYLEYLPKILNSKKEVQELVLIIIYCDMNKNRDKRCDYKSKNLNSAIKTFVVFLLLLIIFMINFGG